MSRATIVLLLALASAPPAGCGDTTGVPRPEAEGDVVAIGWSRPMDPGAPVPRVLRHADGEWTEAVLPESIVRAYVLSRPGTSSTVRGRFRLRQVGFDSATSVWILAAGPDDVGGALLRSDDGGATWRDASDALPDATRFRADVVTSTPLAIWFRSATEWWVAGGERRGPLTVGPLVWRSVDTGRTWERVVARPALTSSGMFFSQLGGRPALLFDDGTPEACTSRLILAGDAPVQPLLACRGFPRDYAEVGDRSWLTVGTAAVFTSTGDLPLAERPVPVDPGRSAFSSSLDFADATHGIACGETSAAAIPGTARTPACWFSADAGGTWEPSQLPTEPGWVAIEDAALSSRERGWAIVGFGTDSDLQPVSAFRFVRTEDGGASWSAVTTDFDDRSGMSQLAAWLPTAD